MRERFTGYAEAISAGNLPQRRDGEFYLEGTGGVPAAPRLRFIAKC